MFKMHNFQSLSTFIQRHQLRSYPSSKRILILIATHADTPLRKLAIHQNLRFLRNLSSSIVIVNTKGTYNISKEDKDLTYLEIENDIMYDFGKWTYGLKHTDLSPYDFILFVNDSIFINKDISAFVHQGTKESVELYGYTDNRDHIPHYQSYIFMIRIDAIPKFIHMVESKKSLIHGYHDLIRHYELVMRYYFSSHGGFLPISTISPKNIYSPKMKSLYTLLRQHNVIPFTKLKQL